jgi:putative methyltransferase (TIGR04325 family)
LSLKQLLRPLVPSIILDAVRSKRTGQLSFNGDYPSWGAASAAAGGYDSNAILERVAAATRRVVNGEAVYERDSMLFDHIEYSWPLLACLLQVALQAGTLRVVDFGGSLGSTLRQNRRFLEHLPVPVSWRVVEQDHFVERGRREFATDTLGFERSIPEAAAQGADVVLFLSSLCYVAEPRLFMEQAAGAARYVIIDRFPLIPGERERVALQTVTEPIYSATYPIRLFAAERIESGLLAGWRVIERWDCDLQPGAQVQWVGYFLERV